MTQPLNSPLQCQSIAEQCLVIVNFTTIIQQAGLPAQNPSTITDLHTNKAGALTAVSNLVPTAVDNNTQVGSAPITDPKVLGIPTFKFLHPKIQNSYSYHFIVLSKALRYSHFT